MNLLYFFTTVYFGCLPRQGASKTYHYIIKTCIFQHNSPQFTTIQHRAPQIFEIHHTPSTNEFTSILTKLKYKSIAPSVPHHSVMSLPSLPVTPCLTESLNPSLNFNQELNQMDNQPLGKPNLSLNKFKSNLVVN
jgi:hypothetical protein